MRIKNEYITDNNGKSDRSVLSISKTPRRKKNIIIDNDDKGKDDDAARELFKNEDQVKSK